MITNIDGVMLAVTIGIMLIFQLICTIYLFKVEVLNEEKWFVYILPLLSKKAAYPIIRYIILGILVLCSAYNIGKYHIIVTLAVLIMLNWIVYLGLMFFQKLTDFASDMKCGTWIILFLIPFCSAMSLFMINSTKIEIDLTPYKMILSKLHIIFSIITLLGTYFLMFNIASNKKSVLDKTKAYQQSDILIAQIYLVFIQVINFIFMIYSLNICGYKIFEFSDKKEISNILDVIYYVIITYSTVGYGDVIPCSTIGKIVSCLISMTGFFTTVCVIGQLVGNMCKKVETSSN